MRTTNVARRVRSHVFAPPLIGACVALTVLGAGLLFATPQIDVPLPPDDATPHPGAPPPILFGLMHLSPDHVARLHFANPELPGPDPNRPAVVRLEFMDTNGAVLLRGEPQVVMPGEMTSLNLVADGLEFPAGSSEIGVRGLVTLFDPQARGISGVQIEDATTNRPGVLMQPLVRSPYLVRKLEPLCTHPLRLASGSQLRINVTNAGDRGFPAAQLVADLVIYAMRPQLVLARKTVVLDPNESDSLVLVNVNRPELFGTVEFQDTASRAVAAASYEYRVGTDDGTLQVSPMTICSGTWDTSSTSGGGGTNSGGA